MDTDAEQRSASNERIAGHRDRGWRWSQLLALVGLTGFAVSQPLLAVAGEDPTLFTFAGVSGWGVVAFALVVALVPPAVLWVAVVLVGSVRPRGGDIAFVIISALLVGATAIQWAKTGPGLEQGWLLASVGMAAAAGFGIALVRVPPVALWTRFTAVLPPVAVLLLLVASPAGDLLRSRSDAPDRAEQADVGQEDALPSVVFIMLDELPLETILAPGGTVDDVRFPNLAAFARESTWYRDYTVQAGGTLQSIPSLLTGQEPTGKRPLWTSHPDSIFKLLAPTHDLAVVEPVTQICGFTNCGIEGARDDQRGGIRSLLSQMGEVWRDRVSLSPLPDVDLDQFAAAAEMLDPETDVRGGPEGGPAGANAAAPRAVSDFIDAVGAKDGSTFGYLHMLLPHQPWIRYPDGSFFDGWSQVELNMGEVEMDDWVLGLLNQVHLYQAQYADRLLGDLMDGLKDAGSYENSLIVVTADHGVGFTDARMRIATPETMGSIAHVPLMVKSPGQQEGRIDDSNLMGVDLLATVAAELGVEVPWEVEGFPPTSPEIAGRGDRKLFYDFGNDFGRELLDVIEFDRNESRPSGDEGPVRSMAEDDHSLAALARGAGAEAWLGAPIEDLDIASADATAVVNGGLNRLRRAGDRAPGRVDGVVEGASEGKVLLAVDGVVQSFSPVNEDGRFVMVIPPEADLHTDAEIDLFHGRDGMARSLDVRP